MKTPEEIGKIVSEAYREALSNYHNVNDFEQEEWDLIKSAEKEVASLIAAEREMIGVAVEALRDARDALLYINGPTRDIKGPRIVASLAKLESTLEGMKNNEQQTKRRNENG